MNEKIFKISIALCAVVFIVLFGILIIPPQLANPDIIGAFAAGFVNPYAAGYSVDVITCWFILAIWIVYESSKVRYGWVCIVLGLIPGVAVGFALYLLLRTKQLNSIE